MDEIQKEMQLLIERELTKNVMMINIFQKNINDNNTLNQLWCKEIQKLEQENEAIVERCSCFKNGNNLNE